MKGFDHRDALLVGDQETLHAKVNEGKELLGKVVSIVVDSCRNGTKDVGTKFRRKVIVSIGLSKSPFGESSAEITVIVKSLTFFTALSPLIVPINTI